MFGIGTGLEALDYVAVAAYLLVTMAIVYVASRKQADTEDFFLGGRSMPWLAVGLSIMATLLSTNTYLGAPGEMIKHGPAYVIGFCAYPLVIAVVVLVWIPFFMRLRMTSAYEYLERRFDYRARFLGNLLFLGLRLGWMSMVVFTASKAMVTMVHGGTREEMLGWITPVIVIVGLAATIYACIGGIRAVIWTDVLQAVMLFGGVAVIIGYVMWHEQSGVGTWWNTIAAQSANPPKVKFFTTDIAERTTIVWSLFAIFAWNVCTHCCDQVALQRYFTTSSLKAARKSFLVSIFSAASIGILLAISGLALRFFYLRHPEPLVAKGFSPESGADDLMPFFYAFQLPAGFAGLILVSFLCDAMQTLVSGVNSISAIITKDVSDRSGQADGNDAGKDQVKRGGVLFARVVTVGVGVFSTLLAIAAAGIALKLDKTIFDMLPRMFNLFLGPLAAMFIVGMFFRRATGNVIVASVLITQLFSFVWSWWGEVPWFFQKLGLDGAAQAWTNILGTELVRDQWVPRTPSVMLAVGVPCLFGIATGWLLSLLAGRKEHPGTQYTWREVMRRPPIGE